MDSPAEYVAKLEADLRSERAARERVERDLGESRAETQALDDLRAGLRLAAVDAAQITERALAQLARDQPVILAAYALCEASARKAPAEEGDALASNLVEAVLAHRKSSPS